MLIFLSAAEASADRYAADLIRALRARVPDLRCAGLGGPRMAEAGCELLADMTARSAMMLSTVTRIPHGLRVLYRTRRYLRANRPDACVFLDSGFLNLPLAKSARRLGLRTLYYIAPQVWASREHRVKGLARDLDHIACILPFEEAYLRARGCRATFVGHPLFESLAAEKPDPDLVQRLLASPAPRVAILPGSRRHVIRENLPAQLEVITRLRLIFPELSCWISATPAFEQVVTTARGRLADLMDKVRPHCVMNQNATVLQHVDLALVTSGTATVEAAHHACPMVVMYNTTPRWAWEWVGRRIVKTPYLCLVNILAGRALVPEFMPYYPGPDPVVAAARELLANSDANRLMRKELADLVAPLRVAGVPDRVAQLVHGLAADAPAPAPVATPA